ncbi:GNAT family N-acetyltransferase [Rhodococcus sp. Q1]|uniref:GNAT family N-acetyltransferase n=1 Tax=Rhodococcus sp. Q1 TaxID=2508718 RepID=UPI00102103FA|nr:GNAT family N-acetyltransferase [Rhodococcus sp. Q1]
MRTVSFEIHDEASATRLFTEWDDLAQELGQRVATRPSYALAWNRMGRGRSAVCTVRRGGRLVGLAPLHARTRLGVTALRLPAHGLATIGTFLATDEAALADLLNGIADRNMALQLDHVDLTDPLVEMLQASPRWSVDIAGTERCLTIDLATGAGAESLRGRRTLKTLSRLERSLAREGTPASVDVVCDPDHLAQRWSDITAVAAAADEHSGRDDFCAPPFTAFTRPLLDAEARAGRLLVVGLLVGDRWMAHEIMFRTGTTAEMWIGRFHPEVRRHQPGQLLQRRLTDRHDELGINRFDYLLGTSEFKEQWANGDYRVGRIVAVPTSRPHHRWTLRAADLGAGLIRPLRLAARDALTSNRS